MLPNVDNLDVRSYPKADIRPSEWHVRFVPIADISIRPTIQTIGQLLPATECLHRAMKGNQTSTPHPNWPPLCFAHPSQYLVRAARDPRWHAIPVALARSG